MVACPRCFGLLFQGAKHCGYCGSAVDVGARVAPDGAAQRLRCPRCDRQQATDLVAQVVGETLLDTCPRCHGTWVDAAAMERIVAERQEQGEVAAAMGKVAAAAERQEIQPVVYVKCPECEGLMNRINFGRRSGVIVDFCKAHGTWFDHDELRKAVTFVMGGGLVEAARRELEEERHKTKMAALDRHLASIEPAVSSANSNFDMVRAGAALVDAIRAWLR
jgi:Zn-finger nucleic acid-binding protein